MKQPDSMSQKIVSFIDTQPLIDVSLHDTYTPVIKSFRDKATEAVFNGENPPGFPSNLLKVARRKLAMVDVAG